MKTIHKYPIKLVDSQAIDMPDGAKILCVQVQNGVACIWAEVDTDAPRIKRVIETYGTGHPFGGVVPVAIAERKYIGTYQTSDGGYIWHVYERV